nr:MAG: hypothetical protein [Wufeng shrew rhabdovirus 2]
MNYSIFIFLIKSLFIMNHTSIAMSSIPSSAMSPPGTSDPTIAPTDTKTLKDLPDEVIYADELEKELQIKDPTNYTNCPQDLFELDTNFFKPPLKLCHTSTHGHVVPYPPRPNCENVRHDLASPTCGTRVVTWAPAIEEQVISAVYCYKQKITKVCTFYFFGAQEHRHDTQHMSVKETECPEFPENEDQSKKNGLTKVNDNLYYKGKYPEFQCYWPSTHTSEEEIIYIQKVKISIGSLKNKHLIISPLIDPHTCNTTHNYCKTKEDGILSWKKEDIKSNVCNLVPLSLLTCTVKQSPKKNIIQLLCDKQKNLFHFLTSNDKQGNLTLVEHHKANNCEYSGNTYYVHRSIENYAISFISDSKFKNDCFLEHFGIFNQTKITASFGPREAISAARKRRNPPERPGKLKSILRYQQRPGPDGDCTVNERGDTTDCHGADVLHLKTNLKTMRLSAEEPSGFQHDLSVAELTWFSSMMERVAEKDVETFHQEQCLLRQEEWDMMEGIKRTNPEAVIKYWMGSSYWFGRLIRGNMEVWKCKKINKYKLLQNKGNSINWPIEFNIEGATLKGYLDATTKEIKTINGGTLKAGLIIPFTLSINETHNIQIYQNKCVVAAHGTHNQKLSYLEEDIIYDAPLFDTVEEEFKNSLETLDQVMAMKLNHDVGYQEFAEENKQMTGFDAVKVGLTAGAVISETGTALSRAWSSLTSGFYGWLFKLFVFVLIVIILLITVKCAIYYKPHFNKIRRGRPRSHDTDIPLRRTRGDTYQ